MALRPRPAWLRAPTVLAVLVLGLVAMTSAQRGGGFGGGMFRGLDAGYDPEIKNVPYDGRFTFVRLKYTVGAGGYYYRPPTWQGRPIPAWAHGMEPNPKDSAEADLTRIVDSISSVHPRLDTANVFGVDDPLLMQYPICYMTEAGFWEMTDQEAAAFRAYLQKGGFVIFDDFRDGGRGGGGWDNFAYNMRRILPEARIEDMDPKDPIFHVFFDIDSFDIIPQAYDRGAGGQYVPPTIRGIYQDNDKNKRLMAIINFNTDISQYWEYSATGFYPVSDANEAYKLGVNYIVYGLTH